MLQLLHIQYTLYRRTPAFSSSSLVVKKSPIRVSSRLRLNKLLKQDLILLCRERNLVTPGCKLKNDYIDVLSEKPERLQPKGRSTPAILKTRVWNTRIGKHIGCIKCPMCLTNELTQLSYEKAHIISRKHGGLMTVENLVPMCGVCNKSLGETDVDMDEYNKNLHILKLAENS